MCQSYMRSALSALVVGLVALSAVVALPAAVGAAPAGDDPTTNRSPSPAATAADTADDDAAAADATAASDHDACAPVANGTQGEHPASDELGWENGCWYDDPIDVTRADGLNDTELDAVVARAMARVERIRDLEFEQTVPVEVVSRTEFRESRESDSEDATPSTANYLHQNVKWEAMLSVGEDENALSTFQSTQTATIGGFYNFAQDRIVIVSENTTAPKMNEITLSQELFHALQDQQLRVSYEDRVTREGNNAGLGIVEGDGNLVDRFYGQRCDASWDCLMPEESGSGGGSDSINYGVYLTQFQPYSDGPKFVRGIYNAGGWDAVNAVYENPPTSTEQVIAPEKYPDEGPADLTFTDRSTEEWQIPDLGEGSADYARFGQAGLSAMFMRPVFASGGTATPVVGPRDFYNLTATGEISDFDPLNYDLEFTDGWGNDRLYPYATDDSAETNETGYVWKTVWDSESDAADFVEGYTTLLEYYGAEPVADRQRTYRIPDETAFGDAFYVNATGTTVTLVNAPTVADLSAVRAGAAPEVQTPTPSPTPTASPTDVHTPSTSPSPTPTDAPTPTDTEPATPTETDESGPETPGPDTETSSDGGPGFGVAAALVALLAGAALARRRR